MKKICSLIKACMTSDMNIFKIKQKKDNKKSSILFPIFISVFFMFAIWSYANLLFEKMAPLHLQNIVLSLFVFLTSIMTIIEGIYKTSSLLFNCKDDQLLLSLPIKKSTVLFIRIFKFYVFELIFNSLFIIPLVIAYIRWGDVLNWTFFLTSFVMIFTLPIIPVVISCIIGAIISSISSRFKYKNLAQIITSTIIILGVLYLSYNLDGILDYLANHATSINDLITKIYYPAGVYANLVTNFKISELLIFILINVIISIFSIFILSKAYFKINSRLKTIKTTKKTNIKNISIKSKSINRALIGKELSTFFNTPVFVVNAGFSLFLFLIATIIILFKYNEVVPILTDPNGISISKELIKSNSSILIFILISFTAYMTSITNSVISLEGRNINILKSLPIKTKNILLSKIYSALTLTTPVLIFGDILLFIKFKISIIEMLLLILLSILIPLVSHFIGLIINLKYPKLDYENSAEVVKQSTSSFISVMIGMLLLIITIAIITKLIKIIPATIILVVFTIIYIIIDFILYIYLINKGEKQFNELSL